MWSDINAKSIYHLPNGSTLGAKDSTGTFNGTVGSATATAGILDGAANVSAGPVSTGNAQNVAGSVTTIAWVNLTTYGNNCHGILDNIASGNGYGLDMNPACVTLTGKIYSTVASGGTFQFNESNESIPSGRWTQVAMTQTGSGRSNNHIYLQGAEVTYNGHSSGSSSIGTSAGTLKIGPDIVSTKFFPGSIDEAQIYTDVKSANWIATASAMQGGQSSAYQIVESSYYTPTIAQFTSCATTDMTVGSFSCVMPFPVTSTGYMIYVLGNTNVSCTTKPTDGLGLTLTQQNTAHFTGTLQEYYDCVYTAPITSTGADTITSGTGNYTAVIYELKGVTTTGIATTSDGSNSPPSAMSATCGGATCFLLCSVNLTNSTGPTYDTYGNSQGYTQAVSPEALPLANDHRAQTYTAYGTVASGSQTCTLSGTGQAGTLTLLPVSATTSTKRRPSQVY